MAKSDARANLRVTRAQINNAATSAQTRAFKARQVAKQRREAEERKLRAALAAERKKREASEPDASGAEEAPEPVGSREELDLGQAPGEESDVRRSRPSSR